MSEKGSHLHCYYLMLRASRLLETSEYQISKIAQKQWSCSARNYILHYRLHLQGFVKSAISHRKSREKRKLLFVHQCNAMSTCRETHLLKNRWCFEKKLVNVRGIIES
jgi:hypothetical protein